MPDQKRKVGPSPLELAASTGMIGADEEEMANLPAVQPSSPPALQNASVPAIQPAGVPAFQPAGPSAVQNVNSPEFQTVLPTTSILSTTGLDQHARSPEVQTSSMLARQQAGTPARQKVKGPKAPKVNSEGWEQQTVYLPPDLRYRLRHYALATNQEISTIAMEALQEYLAKHWRG